VLAGRAQARHNLPESGWVSFYLRQPEDVRRPIALPANKTLNLKKLKMVEKETKQ
jgi:hypothetical protein